MKSIRYAAAMACSLFLGTAQAQPRTFVPYSEDSGIWYELAEDWESLSRSDLKRFEQEGLKTFTSKPTKTEMLFLEDSPVLFGVHKRGNEKGGAVITFRIRSIPPADRFTQSEVRTFSLLEKAFMKQALTTAGKQMASRKVELLGYRDSKLVATEIIDTGGLTCFRLEFSGTLPTGLTPREFNYDCPVGAVALIIMVSYNREFHTEFWPGIEALISSVELD